MKIAVFDSFSSMSKLIYAISFIIISFITDNPIVVFCVFLGLMINVIIVCNLKKVVTMFKFIICIAIINLIINVFLNSNGSTIIFDFYIPVAGRFRIYLEALIYSCNSILRIASVVISFLLYSEIVNPDDVLSLFSKWSNKSITAIILAVRMFPQLREDSIRIKEVLKMRGVSFENGKFKDKIRNGIQLLNILLLSSLEGSMDTAEAMYIRGFGAGEKSYYSLDKKMYRDKFIMITSVLITIAIIIIQITGMLKFNVYDQNLIEVVQYRFFYVGAIILLFSFMPILLLWWCRLWHILRQKI